MSATSLAIVVLIAVALLMGGMLLVVQSFGRYARDVANDNARTRQSCEASAQRASRAELRIAESQADTIEVVRELMKSNPCRERSA